MAVSKLTKITNSQIAEKGVQALSDRPNSASQYGQGGLTATQLKVWFDKLATFLADKINEIQDTLSGTNAAKYIRIALDSYSITTLNELVSAFQSGDFAASVLKLFPSASSQTAVTLQVLINSVAQQISALQTADTELDTDKLDKITSTASYLRVYTVNTDGTQTCHFVSASAMSNALAQYDANGKLKSNTPTADNDVANMSYTNTRDLLLASSIVLSLDPSTYVLNISLKNTSGTTLSSSSVDLPIESLFVGGSYADGVLTLNIRNQDNSTDNNVINIDISDIIDGLVSTTTFTAAVGRLDGRIDTVEQTHTAFVAEVDLSKIYAHAAYHAEESDTARDYTKGGKIDKALKTIDLTKGASLAVSVDSDFKLTVALKNKKGDTISSGMVDLPIESLMTNASYSNKILTLTLQNGQTITVNISDIISGLVPDTRKVNGKALSADTTLTAADVGAYGTGDTYTKTEVENRITSEKTTLEETQKIFGFYAVESEKSNGYIKGGIIDKELKKIKERLGVLEDNT